MKNKKNVALVLGVSLVAGCGALYVAEIKSTENDLQRWSGNVKFLNLIKDWSNKEIVEFSKVSGQNPEDVLLTNILQKGFGAFNGKTTKTDVEEIMVLGVDLTPSRLKLVTEAYIHNAMTDEAFDYLLDRVEDKTIIAEVHKMVDAKYKNRSSTDYRKFLEAAKILNKHLVVPTSMVKDKNLKGIYEIAKAAVVADKLARQI